MAFTKYASFEVSKILDVKGSPERDESASLGRVSAFNDYRTEDGYLYARIRAISSRVNKNHDGWPSVELAGSQDIFDHHTASSESGFTVNASKDAEYGFSTFLGKPIFVDHHNSDPSRARGVIVDAKLHVDDHKTAAQKDSYYRDAPANHTPPTWVELLLEVDAKSFPKLAKAILDGSKNAKHGIDGFSMGCDVEQSVCNICKNAASTPDEFCNHVRMKGAYFDAYDDMGRKTSKKSYEDCYGIKFFEISAVFDPADETALIREVRSSVTKESSMNKTARRCQHCDQDSYPDGYGCLNPACHESDWGEPTGRREILHFAVDKYGRPVLEGGNHEGPFHYDPEAARGNIDSRQQYRGDIGTIASMNKFAPIGEYDKYFGGKPGSAKKAYDSMIDQYGDKKGKEVFYATMNKKKNQKEAVDKDKPQSFKTRAPEDVDTLREDTICEVCGKTMDGPQCDVCGYEKPPSSFGDPDLTTHKEKSADHEGHDGSDDGKIQELERKIEEIIQALGIDVSESSDDNAISSLETDTNISPTVAHVTNATQKVAQINKVERPVLPVQSPPATNEPKENVVKDPKGPNTSSVRTASDFLAVARNKQRNNMETHIADAEMSAPAVAKPDYHTDVTGTGGIADASNESASKADAQVDVTEIGGVSGVGIGDEKTVEVAQGDEHSKNIEAIHTDTFGPNQGDSLGQESPVSNQPFPESAEGVKSSHWVISDVNGTEPADSMGKAQDRIDVSHGNAHSITTQDSGPTKTWTGTEGNGVTRQADPVDPQNKSFYADQNSTENHPTGVSDQDYAFGDKSSHLMAAFKLADTEIELGLLDASQKYARIAELEKAAPSVVEASLDYANRVKTAGLKKSARVSRRLPSLVKGASTVAPETQEGSDDSALFM